MNFRKLKSRKFLVTIISAVLYGVNLIVLKEPYTPEQIMPISIVIVGWLFAQGWVDGKTEESVPNTARNLSAKPTDLDILRENVKIQIDQEKLRDMRLKNEIAETRHLAAK